MQPAFGGDRFFQLIPSEFGVEIGGINDLQTLLRGERFGALTDQHPVLALRHNRVYAADRVADGHNFGQSPPLEFG